MKIRVFNVMLTVFVPAVILMASLGLANHYRVGQYLSNNHQQPTVFAKVMSAQFV